MTIDKRISYRGGGSYRGGSSRGTSGPGPGGQGARGQATQNPGVGGGRGGGPDPREQAAQRAREQAAKRATEEKKKRDAAIKAQKDIEAKQAAKDKAAKEKKQREEQEKRSKEKGEALHGGPTVKEALAPIKKKRKEEQEARSKELGEALHGGPTVEEAVDKGKLTKLIRDQALEKMDVIPDDTTQLDLNKFGETVIPEALPKGHPDRIEEETEETVKQLSTPEGTKEALKEFKALDTGRRYTPDFNLLEKLGVKRPEGILGSLVDTGQKYLDPKKMIKDAAIKYGMKKMGLGAINPYIGLASLLKDTKLNPLNWFKRKPRDMTAFNKLGLYDEGTPAAADTLTAKARDAYNLPLEGNVIAENIAKFTGKDTGGKSMMEDFYANQGSWSERVGGQLGTNLQEAGLNLPQTAYLDKLAKMPTAVGHSGFLEYESPETVREDIQKLDPKSESLGWTGYKFDPDKITYGDPKTFATDQDVISYMKEKHGLTPTGSVAGSGTIGLADGGLINLFKYGGFLG